MESFMVAVRVVVPMALLLGVGALARMAKIISRDSMQQMDKLLFRLFMPTLLFKNIYTSDLSSNFNIKLVVFSVLTLLAVFIIALLVPPRFERDHNKAASIGQAVIRSNYILFGIAVAESIYGKGNAGVVSLMGALAVPMTNALSVVILELNRSGKASPWKIFLSILKNPMVAAALLALSMQLFRIQLPDLIEGVVGDISDVTTTLCFISLGVSLDLSAMRNNRRPLAFGILLRMVLVPLIFLPLSIWCGFRGQDLCALMIMFAAPAAVASYPMAVAMGADGQLSGQLVVGTTLVSIFTIFVFTFFFRSFGLL